MRKAWHFISGEKQVFLVGLSLTFPRFPRKSKNRLNTSLCWKKKWRTWTVLLRLVFLDNEYSFEVFQTLLTVSNFSNVARKSQKQSSRGGLWKGVFENLANQRCCFPVNFRRFSRTPFFIEQPLVAASKKLKEEAVFWRCSVEKMFLEISQNSQENTCTRVSFLQP